VSFRSGHRHDVGSIGDIAHAHGALLLADSYQAAGVVPIDVGSFGADVVTGGTVKYLLGSAGLGFMWVRGALLSGLRPTQTGWFADEDIFAMSIADYSPHASARRFDSGTPPVPSLYPGVAGASIVEEVGVPAIEAHVSGLAARLIDGLVAIGADVVTPREAAARGPLVCVRATDVVRLCEELASERIVTSHRDDVLRVSLHLYNVAEDVDRVVAALESRRHLLATAR
jgi:selenocysteine lyase/cysteine desulfurase